MDRVLIVEDDQTIRETLEYNLSEAGYSVSTAADGQAGLEKALAEKPNAILLDLMLPKIDGLAVCREIRRRDGEVRIIMITALGASQSKIEGLSGGADDYITKPFDLDELLARLRAQLRRRHPVRSEPDVLAFGDILLEFERHELTIAGQPVAVSPKEWRLLALLAANPGRLFNRQQLAESIWGTDFLSSSRTIDVHIRRLRTKVEKRSAYQFIKTIHGLGYRFELAAKANND